MFQRFSNQIFTEKIFRLGSLAVAVLIALSRYKSTNILLFSILLIVNIAITLLITYLLKNYRGVSPHLLSFLDAVVSLLSISLTGGVYSPFLLYLFSVVFSFTRILDPLSTSLYTIFLMLFVLADLLLKEPQMFSENFFIFLPPICAVILFAGFVSYLNAKYRTPKKKEKVETTPGPIHPKTKIPDHIMDVLWDMVDVEKELQISFNIESATQHFLSFLSRNDFPPEIILVLKIERTAEYIELKDGELSVKNAEEAVDFEDRKFPQSINLQTNSEPKKFNLSSQTPEAVVYLKSSKETSPFVGGAVTLIANLYVYQVSELALETKEKVYLSRFSSLHLAARQISEKIEMKPVIEATAEAIKQLTGMEKVIVMLAEKPEDIELDYERTVIKGKRVEHPEQFWKDDLIRVGKACLKDMKPMVFEGKEAGTHILCAPMKWRDKTIGLVAGISSLSKEELLAETKTIEIITSLASTTIQNIELMKQREATLSTTEKENMSFLIFNKALLPLADVSISLEDALHTYKEEPSKGIGKLSRMKLILQNNIANIRKLILNLNPNLGEEIGLKPLLEKIISHFTDRGARINLKIEDYKNILLPEIEVSLLLVIYESISNAFYHGEPENIWVSLKKEQDNLILTVKDDGKGFSPKKTLQEIKQQHRYGIKTMFRVIKSIDGSLKLSSAPGKGTRVMATVPLKKKG